MPFTARKTNAKKGKPWSIVNKKTGRTVGHSTSKSKAMKSASIRNRGHT